jgi:hypothetical protein
MTGRDAASSDLVETGGRSISFLAPAAFTGDGGGRDLASPASIGSARRAKS